MTITLLDIAKRNGSDAVTGLIDEASQAHPEITGFTYAAGRLVQIPGVAAARTIRGRLYKTLIRTALPTVSFRSANEGVAGTKASHENRLVETYILNPSWPVDKAVADSSEDGPEAMIADEADAHMQAAFNTLGSCFYYGNVTGNQTLADAKGFPGLMQAYSSSYEVDATGTTASTASSVWAVKFGRKNVQWVWGERGTLEVSEIDLRSVSDGSNDYTAYFQELWGYPGLQVGDLTAVGRIKNLTEDSGKGLTDDLVAQLLAKFPTSVMPDVLFMTRRSLRQLQQSRTATNSTGAPAPFPVESHMVPIAVTDSIRDTEAIE